MSAPDAISVDAAARDVVRWMHEHRPEALKGAWADGYGDSDELRAWLDGTDAPCYRCESKEHGEEDCPYDDGGAA